MNKDAIKREIRKYFKLKGNENTTHWIQCDATKVLFGGNVSSPPHPCMVLFLWFQLPGIDHSLKILDGKFQK